MATVIGTSHYKLSVKSPRSAPYPGSDGPEIDSVISVQTGTSANQANLLGGVEFTIAASGTATKDLLADFLDPNGAALSSLVEVVEIYITVSGNTAGSVEITQAASNAWAGLLDGATDNIVLGDGDQFIKRNWDAGGIAAVSASLKDIKFTNGDASNTVTITCWVVGRNA